MQSNAGSPAVNIGVSDMNMTKLEIALQEEITAKNIFIQALEGNNKSQIEMATIWRDNALKYFKYKADYERVLGILAKRELEIVNLKDKISKLEG